MKLDFRKAKILVYGDVMIDEYIYGHVDRISPEAPVPVFIETHREAMPGGAANVAANVAALGAKAALLGISGDKFLGMVDIIAPGRSINPMLKTNPDVNLCWDQTRIDTIKRRFIANGQQLLRIDIEDKRPISDKTENNVLFALQSHLQRCDAIIVSDYAKGAVTQKVFNAIINSKKPIFVDPKRSDLRWYLGAHYICPNVKELSAFAVGWDMTDDISIEKALLETRLLTGANILLTRGDKGMMYAANDGAVGHVGTKAVHNANVCGAGDTVIAAFACAIMAGYPDHEAMLIANCAAGIAVSNRGTHAVSIKELREATK